jgi:thiol peroxidase
MATVTLKGKEVQLKGNLPKVGAKAEDFTAVKTDLSEFSLYDFEGKVKVVLGVPSLDTGTCALETKTFNKKLAEKEGVVGIVISKDLPFAQRRFCETQGIKNVVALSDYRYNDFCNEYKTEIISGVMKGLSARAVFVVDKANVIRYVQLVPEIGQEPDYDSVLAAVDEVLKG